jgi:hypothetical protein
MRRGRGLAVSALAIAVVAGGCGDDDGAPAAQAGGDRLGVPVRLADCESWRDAGVRERYDTIAALRGFAGDRTGSPGGHGATLGDERAYDLLERGCEPPYARAFKLYKLYTRAAAFTPRDP